MAVTIRPATADDTAELLRMGRDFINTTPYAQILAANVEAMERSVMQLLANPDAVILVPETKLGNVVGMLGLIKFFQPFSGERWVSELFWWVDKNFRATGAAYRLLRAGELWSREQGAVRLSMVAPDETVKDIYRRWGYTEYESSFYKKL